MVSWADKVLLNSIVEVKGILKHVEYVLVSSAQTVSVHRYFLNLFRRFFDGRDLVSFRMLMR